MSNWPMLKHYDQDHLANIAMPIGGIGTGTVSLGGRGDLRDWELMNRPAKGFAPRGDGGRGNEPFFALYAKPAGGSAVTRALEGPVDVSEYQGASGSVAVNHGLPRFAQCAFAAAYPLAQVQLSDPQVPVAVCLEAFNPFIPANADDSGIPIAVLRYTLTNRTNKRVTASVCGSLPNFIGNDGVEELAQANRNRFRKATHCQGIFMDSKGVEPTAISYGTMALTTTAKTGITYRTAWKKAGWGTSLLDFWDDFAADGRVEKRPGEGVDMPSASLVVRTNILPKATQDHHLFADVALSQSAHVVAGRRSLPWQLLCDALWRCVGRGQQNRAEAQKARTTDRALCLSLGGKRPARGRKGSRPFQSQHPAHANVFPHSRWTFIWLGGIQR